MSTAPAAAARQPAPVAYLLLAALSLFWGLNWPIMKVALGEIPVLPFRALCLLGSGPLLLAIAALRGDPMALRRHEVGPLLLAALLNVTLWHLFSAYGVSLASSPTPCPPGPCCWARLSSASRSARAGSLR